jgi:hypothetical protein
MKLKKFEIKRMRDNDSVPRISINGRNGLIILYPETAEKLGLKKDDTIGLYQDEDSLIDWFIKKETGDNTFKLRDYKTSLAFTSANLSRKMLSSMVGGDKTRTTVRFIVSGKPYEGYHAILANSKK